jgi:large subunit ribosomal protein L13e
MINVRPLVFRKGGKQRNGRGFSRGELKEAGLSLKDALKLKIPIDKRRKTLYKENVSAIKKLLENQKRRKSKN